MPETVYDEEYISDGQGKSTLVKRVPRVLSDDAIARRDTPTRLRQMNQTLVSWANECDIIANQSTNITQAQLKQFFQHQALFFNRFREFLINQGFE